MAILLKPTHHAEQPYRLIKLNDIVNDASWDITQAYSINDRGYIIAIANQKGTEASKAILLKPHF